MESFEWDRLRGLKNETVSFSGYWDPNSDIAGAINAADSTETELTVEFKLNRELWRIGRLVMALQGEVGGIADQEIQIWMPMDRRQARRVARKTGRKFTMIRGEASWR